MRTARRSELLIKHRFSKFLITVQFPSSIVLLTVFSNSLALPASIRPLT